LPFKCNLQRYTVAAATMLWTVRRYPTAAGAVDGDGVGSRDDASWQASAFADVPVPAWGAAGLTVLVATWLLLVPLSTFSFGGGRRALVQALVPSYAEGKINGGGFVGGRRPRHSGILSSNTAVSPMAFLSTSLEEGPESRGGAVQVECS
jgi:hypothetical protein